MMRSYDELNERKIRAVQLGALISDTAELEAFSRSLSEEIESNKHTIMRLELGNNNFKFFNEWEKKEILKSVQNIFQIRNKSILRDLK